MPVERPQTRSGPRLQPSLRSVRWAWLTRGLIIGNLLVVDGGFRFEPSTWVQALFKMPTIDIPNAWLAKAEVVPLVGKPNTGILELRFADGSGLAFTVAQREHLTELLAHRGHA